MEIISKGVNKVYKVKKGLFKYQEISVIKDFNYKITQGEIIGLIGINNSGKSVTINLLSGRETPTSGKIYIDGEVDYKKLKDNCEIINDFNKWKLLASETIYNNLLHFGKKFKLNNLDVEKKITELRDIFEFDKIINKRIEELSFLDLVKLNISISMLRNPFVLFFDSALEDLDYVSKSTILKLLKRLNKEFKTTIVIASDDLMDIEKICKRISIIKKGKVVIDGEYECIKKEYLNHKIVSISFSKSFNVPKGDFTVVEASDYYVRIRIDFNKYDFASLINQFDINTIVDINISSDYLSRF